MYLNADNYFSSISEPTQSCLLSLRHIILGHHTSITPEWKYGMPFFYYKGKMLCYLWINKKTGQPYIGFADGNKMDFPELIQEKRSRMKILNLNPHKDLPIKKIKAILDAAISIKEER